MRSYRWFLSLILSLLLSISWSAHAVKVSALYDVLVPVASQAESDRTQGIRQGLQQVFVRVSGDASIVDKPSIKAALRKPEQYVQEYSYAEATSPIPTAAYMLKLRFDPIGVTEVLKSTGVAVWGENRPLILLWLAVSSNQAPEMVGNASPSPVYTLLKKQSMRDGLPIIFPVMDITDLNLMPAEDLLSTPTSVVLAASKRYRPEAVLLGQWQQTGTQVQSKWRLTLGAQEWDWSISGTDQAVAMALANNISHALSKRDTVQPNRQTVNTMKLAVSGISQADDLAQVVHTLKQIPSVKRVQLLEVHDDQVTFMLYLQNSIENFQQDVALNPHLVLESKDNPSGEYLYSWVP